MRGMPLDPNAIGAKTDPQLFEWTDRDTLLYALGVGAGTNPLDDGDLNGFFDDDFDVDLNFRVAFHDKVVAVPRGGGTRGVEIKVTPK